MRGTRRVSAAALGVVLGVGGAFLGGVRAHADKIHVHPGDSIQAAVDKAEPGDTIVVDPGTYHQTVTIRKDGITLKAAHPDEHDTKLVPPASSNDFCTQFNPSGKTSGICVLAKTVDQNGNVITPVKDVTVDGFAITGFGDSGVLGFGVHGFTVRHVRAADNAAYGIVAFSSHKVTFTSNRTSGAGEAGLYLGDSPDADADIYDNTSWNNQFGIFIRHARHAEVTENTAKANCVGIVIFDDGQPGGVGNLKINDNKSEANDKFCPAVSEGRESHPAFSGIGILMVGMTDSKVVHNKVEDNKPSQQVRFSGGLVLFSATRIDGGSDPMNNTFDDNDVTENVPVDILWDGSGGSTNVFKNNDCGTSQPSGLCE